MNPLYEKTLPNLGMAPKEPVQRSLLQATSDKQSTPHSGGQTDKCNLSQHDSSSEAGETCNPLCATTV